MDAEQRAEVERAAEAASLLGGDAAAINVIRAAEYSVGEAHDWYTNRFAPVQTRQSNAYWDWTTFSRFWWG